MTVVTLERAIENAEAYKQIGITEIYLWEQEQYPWEYVTAIRSGGGHRLNISTSICLTASHPCGLDFRWLVDFEKYDARKEGRYEVDVAGIEAVRLALADNPVLVFYEQYLCDCADAIEKVALSDMDFINRELAAVASMRGALRAKP